MEKQRDKVRLSVRFSAWGWDQLRSQAAEIEVDPFKPVTAAVAEGVEAIVRDQLENGATREVRVEPTSWNGGQYNGQVTVVDPAGGHERTSYWAEIGPVPEPKHAEAEA